MRVLAISAGALLAFAGPALAQDLNGFERRDLSGYEIREAASLMALVEPLFRGYPGNGEGRPILRVDVRKEVDGSFRIEVELSGLLENSIETIQHRAYAGFVGGTWKLEALGWRQRCNNGRGFSSSWTTRPCN